MVAGGERSRRGQSEVKEKRRARLEVTGRCRVHDGLGRPIIASQRNRVSRTLVITSRPHKKLVALRAVVLFDMWTLRLRTCFPPISCCLLCCKQHQMKSN
jgi:hypothetical protein